MSVSLKTGSHGEGFNFDNVGRNVQMMSKVTAERPQQQLPQAMKTGTTIVGVVYNDGVVLAADTRATAGNVVADKQCQKIHYMAPNIMCCGAGTAVGFCSDVSDIARCGFNVDHGRTVAGDQPLACVLRAE